MRLKVAFTLEMTGNELTDSHTKRQTDGQMDRWMDRQTDGRINVQSDSQTKRQTDGLMVKVAFTLPLCLLQKWLKRRQMDRRIDG